MAVQVSYSKLEKEEKQEQENNKQGGGAAAAAFDSFSSFLSAAARLVFEWVSIVCFVVLLCSMMYLVYSFICACIEANKTWPEPEEPVIRIENFTVSDLTANAPFLTANWDTQVSILNPNANVTLKFKYWYSNVNYHGGDPLAHHGAREVFDTDPNTTSFLRLHHGVDNRKATVVGGRKVVQDIDQDMKNGSVVSFDFKMRFWIEGPHFYRKNVDVTCSSINVKLVGENATTSGNATGTPIKCLNTFTEY